MKLKKIPLFFSLLSIPLIASEDYEWTFLNGKLTYVKKVDEKLLKTSSGNQVKWNIDGDKITAIHPEIKENKPEKENHMLKPIEELTYTKRVGYSRSKSMSENSIDEEDLYNTPTFKERKLLEDSVRTKTAFESTDSNNQSNLKQNKETEDKKLNLEKQELFLRNKIALLHEELQKTKKKILNAKLKSAQDISDYEEKREKYMALVERYKNLNQ